MDKYQEELFVRCDIGYRAENEKENTYVHKAKWSVPPFQKKYRCEQSKSIERISIKQRVDKKLKYILEIVGDVFEGVSAYKQGEWAKVETSEIQEYKYQAAYGIKTLSVQIRTSVCLIDFNDRVEKIRIEFNGGVADPLELDVEYLETPEADYKEWLKREAAKRREEEQRKKEETVKILRNAY